MSPTFSVESLDHVVLTVKSIEATVKFYTERLGMKHEVFKSPKDTSVERHSLKFGHQKINLHLAGHEFEPKAKTALPGTADLVSRYTLAKSSLIVVVGSFDVTVF